MIDVNVLVLEAARAEGGEWDPGELLDELEAALVASERQQSDNASLRAELASAAEENDAILAEWDRALAERSKAPPESIDGATEFDSVADVLRWAEDHLDHIDVSPEAHRSADGYPYRWPERLADELRVLDDIARQWADGTLRAGITMACRETGLRWKSGIGDFAATNYEADYIATLPNGTKVTCGPHLAFGSSTGPAGHLRCYLYLDDDAKRILVGPTGRHGRDRGNR